MPLTKANINKEKQVLEQIAKEESKKFLKQLVLKLAIVALFDLYQYRKKQRRLKE